MLLKRVSRDTSVLSTKIFPRWCNDVCLHAKYEEYKVESLKDSCSLHASNKKEQLIGKLAPSSAFQLVAATFFEHNLGFFVLAPHTSGGLSEFGFFQFSGAMGLTRKTGQSAFSLIVIIMYRKEVKCTWGKPTISVLNDTNNTFMTQEINWSWWVVPKRATQSLCGLYKKSKLPVFGLFRILPWNCRFFHHLTIVGWIFMWTNWMLGNMSSTHYFACTTY